MNQRFAPASLHSPLPPARRRRQRPTAVAAAAVCLALACAGQPTEPAGTATAAAPAGPETTVPATTEALRRPAPLVLEVTGPEHPQPGSIITVTADIRRAARDGAPVELALIVPEGVRVVSGPDRARVPNGEHQRQQWVLAVDAIPAEDVRVVAEVRGCEQAQLLEAAKKLPGVIDAEISPHGNWHRLLIRGGENSDLRNDVFQMAAGRNWQLRELRREVASLEDFFVQITYQQNLRTGQRLGATA